MGGLTLGRGLFALGAALAVAGVSVPPTATPARAAEPESNDGTGFLVISVDPTFSLPDVSLHCQSSDDGGCHDNRCGCKKRKRNDKKNCECDLPAGSSIVIVPVGTFVAGYDVRNTGFDSFGETQSDALADLIAGLGGLEGLDGNQATLFGAVDTTGPNSIHLMTPDPAPVPPQVQEAIFFADPDLFALDPADPAYPNTTVELANFIFLHQAPPDFSPFLPPATLQEILDYLFLSADTLECSQCNVEGSLFPHDPETDDPLFAYTLTFDENGSVTAEGCTLVTTTVFPDEGGEDDPIELGGESVTLVQILSSRGSRPDGQGGFETVTFFDPSGIDPDTVTLQAHKDHDATGQDWVGASPIDSLLYDVNGDGVDDLLLFFVGEDLGDPDLGGMTADTTEVEVHGDTFDGVCIFGTDAVTATSD